MGATASTPAPCQLRRRRQHVIPGPHPSCCGSICQGIPLRSTKTMPVRHARSETRGRPPCVRCGEIGKNSWTRSHNGSGSSVAPMPVHATSPTTIKFRRFCYRPLRSWVPENPVDDALLGNSSQTASTVAELDDRRGRQDGLLTGRDLFRSHTRSVSVVEFWPAGERQSESRLFTNADGLADGVAELWRERRQAVRCRPELRSPVLARRT